MEDSVLRRFPASGHDIGNYMARYGMANSQIQAVMKLDGRLDYELLSKAVRLSVDEELVLGCRFVVSNPPYWKRIKDLDEGMLTSLELSDKPDAAVMRYLTSPLNHGTDAMVKVRLIRSPEYDTLCVKVNHACADGAGAKEYLQVLSRIYTQLASGGEFVPQPKMSGREDQDRLLRQLRLMGLGKPPVPGLNSLDKALADFKSSFDPQVTSPASVWSFPWKKRGSDSVRFSMVRFPAGQLDEMSRYCKARGATINDLVLAATYRAMFRISKTPYGVPMDISMTMDLRRYLPDQKALAIRNLTGGFFTKLSRVRGESFEGTLSRVVQMTRRIKEGRPGVNCIIGAEYTERVLSRNIAVNFRIAQMTSRILSVIPVYYGNRGFATISNVGFVSDTPLVFGECTVTDAYIVPPVIRGPGYVMVVCSYNGIMTLMIGYYKKSISHRHIDNLLERIRKDITEACRLGSEAADEV